MKSYFVTDHYSSTRKGIVLTVLSRLHGYAPTTNSMAANL